MWSLHIFPCLSYRPICFVMSSMKKNVCKTIIIVLGVENVAKLCYAYKYICVNRFLVENSGKLRFCELLCLGFLWLFTRDCVTVSFFLFQIKHISLSMPFWLYTYLFLNVFENFVVFSLVGVWSSGKVGFFRVLDERKK